MSEYRIVIAGDLLPSANNLSLFESGRVEDLFDDKIRALFNSAVFSIINLEGPLTNAVSKQDKIGPVLKASRESVNGIKSLGVKCVALANNHFTDYCQQGCKDTIASIEEVGMEHIGGGLTINSINNYTTVFLGDKRVCIYNVSESFFNIADGNHAGVNIYDEYLVCNEIKELKNIHDFLIVIYHGGTEFCEYPSPALRKRFRRMADCGADYITAQHSHRIGCEENYHNSKLLYGQGNFFLDHMKNPTAREGLVTEIVFNAKGVSILHHIVRIVSGRLLYDDMQDFSMFYSRSKEIEDEAVAIRRYEDFIWNNTDLKNKYYQAFSGSFGGRRLIGRVSQNFLLKLIEGRYSYKQLSRIIFSLESDRMREDIGFLWRGLKKHKYERNKSGRVKKDLL